MRMSRVLTLVLSFSLLGAAGAVASSIWGDFEGYPKAKVLINDWEKSFDDGETPAFLIKGRAVLPVRAISDSLNALVKWDNASKTVAIYKPNVHIIVAKKVDNDYSIKQPFGGVKKGDQLDFAVFAQVDSLKTPISEFRITIDSPSGQQVAYHEKAVNGGKESFWYTWPFNVSFDEAGQYTVKFAVNDGGGYTVVSEKAIVSE